MSSFQHPLKRDIDQALAKVNELHQAYNLYFQGVEKLPPMRQRKELEDKLVWLRSEVLKKSSASLSFALRQTEARLQILRSRWDKTMAEIEAGTFRIPAKRR